MGKLKLMTIIGTRPEIIRLSATIKCCDRYFEQILVHTGQNYDYTLNQVFFDDLGLRAPDYYLDAVGDDLGATILMVTHDAFSASYANRILFMRDGAIFMEIRKGGDSRRTFFEKILDVLTMMGGGMNDVR